MRARCECQYDSNSLQALFRSRNVLMPRRPSCSSISLLVSHMMKTPAHEACMLSQGSKHGAIH